MPLRLWQASITPRSPPASSRQFRNNQEFSEIASMMYAICESDRLEDYV